MGNPSTIFEYILEKAEKGSQVDLLLTSRAKGQK